MSTANVPANPQVYYRLVALWVLCEAMLGGIIHGFKIPVSGLVVGSCAVVCICLIGWYVPLKGAIIRATVIVAVFKMMLSPQAPPPAYIAVFFQGLLGELLFWRRRHFALSCMLLAVLSLLESGLQRILVLTIIYGNDLWKVVNNFLNGLTGQKVATNYSLIIGGGYVLIHFIAGLVVGWWASVLPGKILRWQAETSYHIPLTDPVSAINPVISAKRKRRKAWLFVTWIILLGLYIQSYFKIGTPLLPSHISIKILLRSLIIVLAWVFIIAPLLRQILQSWLQKKQRQSQPAIQKVLALLPETQSLIAQSWKKASEYKGVKRLMMTGKLILVNALGFAGESGEIFILTGPVQTGKTTSLLDWAVGRDDVMGILTPVQNGKRVFMDIGSREIFAMEAVGDEETLEIGRFVFSKAGFARAAAVINKNKQYDGWLVLDEIGPLELKGEGFSDVLKEILAERRGRTLIVIRDKDQMLAHVLKTFKISNPVILRNISEIKKHQFGENPAVPV